MGWTRCVEGGCGGGSVIKIMLHLNSFSLCIYCILPPPDCFFLRPKTYHKSSAFIKRELFSLLSLSVSLPLQKGIHFNEKLWLIKSNEFLWLSGGKPLSLRSRAMSGWASSPSYQRGTKNEHSRIWRANTDNIAHLNQACHACTQHAHTREDTGYNCLLLLFIYTNCSGSSRAD